MILSCNLSVTLKFLVTVPCCLCHFLSQPLAATEHCLFYCPTPEHGHHLPHSSTSLLLLLLPRGHLRPARQWGPQHDMTDTCHLYSHSFWGGFSTQQNLPEAVPARIGPISGCQAVPIYSWISVSGLTKTHCFEVQTSSLQNAIPAHAQGTLHLWGTPEAAGMLRDSQAAKNRGFEGQDDIHVAKVWGKLPLTDTFPFWQPAIPQERPALSTQWSCKESHSIAAYRQRTQTTTGCWHLLLRGWWVICTFWENTCEILWW